MSKFITQYREREIERRPRESTVLTYVVCRQCVTDKISVELCKVCDKQTSCELSGDE